MDSSWTAAAMAHQQQKEPDVVGSVAVLRRRLALSRRPEVALAIRIGAASRRAEKEFKRCIKNRNR